MSAELVSINGNGKDLSASRQKRMREEFYKEWRQERPGGGVNSPLGQAGDAYIGFLEGRIRQLESKLRAIVASDAMDGPERLSLLTMLYGAKGGTRDGKLLSEAEYDLITRYRGVDDLGRQALRRHLRMRRKWSSSMNPRPDERLCAFVRASDGQPMAVDLRFNGASPTGGKCGSWSWRFRRFLRNRSDSSRAAGDSSCGRRRCSGRKGNGRI